MRHACALLLSSALAAQAAAEPRIQLKVPSHAGGAFPNFSTVVLPENHGPVEIWLEDALAEIQVSTIRVMLNESPMTPFVALNPLPRGVRAIVKIGASLNPDYTLRPSGENILAFAATDSGSVTYRAQFYLSLDAQASAPRLASVRSRAPIKEVEAPPQHRPPRVAFTSEWPSKTSEQFLTLAAEVVDDQGIVRVVLEVNGKDVEEIVLENEWPVRKQKGFVARGRPPGEVTGDGRRLALSIPVKLGKDLTVVALRAENSLGLRTRTDRVVERTKK